MKTSDKENVQLKKANTMKMSPDVFPEHRYQGIIYNVPTKEKQANSSYKHIQNFELHILLPENILLQ